MQNEGGEDFFAAIEPFSEFAEFTSGRNYKVMPKGWRVFITDVKGSTQAIESGRYKDVNTIGAASIVAAQNALKDFEFPFVFGGDGATLAVPESRATLVTKELVKLKLLSEKNFGLGLRVGSVAVSELLAEGSQVAVGKFDLGSGRCIAVFRGGGLDLAEKKIKGDEAQYGHSIESSDLNDADLEGLSCRWQPIPSQRGTMLTLLVVSRSGDAPATYKQVLARLEEVLGGESSAPIHPDQMEYRSVLDSTENERRYFGSVFSKAFFRRIGEILFATFLFRSGKRTGEFDPKDYQQSLLSHSDYRKFDDTLRMIIDCTIEQADAISQYLEQQHADGQIYYGAHRSKDCLMTCFVRDTQPGNHIHFIDGGDGGYAIAAKQLKAQMKG